MALKEDLKYIKEEIGTEEKFFESFLRLEKFFKKYKILLIVLAAGIIVGTVGYQGYLYFKERRLLAASEAYAILLKNPEDASAKAILEEKNKDLYEIFLFSEAMHSGDVKKLEAINVNNPILKDLVHYSQATLSGNATDLAQYSNIDSALMKDFAILQEAFLLLKDEKLQEADAMLAKIDFRSPLRNIAIFLKHYTVKGSK